MTKTKQELLKKLQNYDIITFDMFDTLITRCVYKPNHLLMILSCIVSEKFNVKQDTFYKQYKKATQSLRAANRRNDAPLSQIYKKIISYKTFTREQLNQIEKIHHELEIKFAFPRKDMLDVYNKLLKYGKKLIIVSDMYLPSSCLKKMLNKCGYYNFDRIIVSNEYGGTKMNGLLWKKFFKEYKNQKIIHVGDNIQADYLSLKNQKREAIKITKGTRIANKERFHFNTNNLFSSILYGLIVNKTIANSPFKLNKNPIQTCFDYGYSILGPVFIYYFMWVCQNKDIKQMLFISREGYYLQKIYKKFVNTTKLFKEIPNTYLYASRRAALLASIENKRDIRYTSNYLLYKGTAQELFKNRFSIEIDPRDNKKLGYLNRYLRCGKIAKKYEDKILEITKEYRKNYLKYLKSKIKPGAWIIDLGYKGTAQYFISKALKMNLSGAYFATKTKRKYNFRTKIIHCFPFPVLIHHLTVFTRLFETFLTAPDGQFLEMNSKGKPVFANDVISKEDLAIRDTVLQGIYKLIDDLVDFGAFNFDVNLNAKQLYLNVYKFYNLCNSGYVSDELNELFSFTDLLKSNKKRYFFKPKK